MTGDRPRQRKGWIGKWFMAVGLLHFVAGFFLYSAGWRTIIDRGVVAAVHDHDETATAFWFMVVGPLVLIIGGLIDWAERGGLQLPRWLGAAMVLLLAVLIIPMPLTGAWLLVPPAVALLMRAGMSRQG